MKKKSKFPYLAVILGILLLIALQGGAPVKAPELPEETVSTAIPFPSPTEPATEAIPAETEAVIDRYPSLPEEMHDHYLLETRRYGYCDTLRGNVGVTVVYVDDDNSCWTREEMDSYTARLYQGASVLCAEAAQWDVDLQISIHTVQSRITGNVESGTADGYVSNMMLGAGLDSVGMNRTQEALLGVDEAPIVFALNKIGRAYAQQGAEGEYCVLFQDPQPIAHEMTHLFGSEDYYFHPQLREYARQVFGDTIMLDSAVQEVDDLTAYAIGWTDELTQDAYGFLSLASTISRESLDAAIDSNLFTGYGVRVMENGIYDGDLEFGSPNGYGVMYYNSGSVYEGQWLDGLSHGHGTCTWKNGDFYEGAWVRGERTGYGFYRWSDGTTYEGDFVEGSRTGYGTLTYPNGGKLTGKWENNQFLG